MVTKVFLFQKAVAVPFRQPSLCPQACKTWQIFLNRMLELLRNNYDALTITLAPEFKRDLRWFDKILVKYNGTSFFDHKPVFGVLELDVCVTGLGGRYNNKVYHLVVVLNNGKTRDPFLVTCASIIWYCIAQNDISLSYTHVLGKNNQVADLLSRWQITQQQVAQLWACVENPIWLHTSLFLLELDYEI